MPFRTAGFKPAAYNQFRHPGWASEIVGERRAPEAAAEA
jgi:hypothetical protein